MAVKDVIMTLIFEINHKYYSQSVKPINMQDQL